jgi:maltose alpha-D-glucosyltransferase/alpha-amylase
MSSQGSVPGTQLRPQQHRRKAALLEEDPLWYKDAIIYELHVRAFYDSNGDGIGDFAGLCEKLPYLQDLGVTAIWLLPFYPSPLRDDGYDIQDYCDVHPTYGTLRDFREFLEEAHHRGLRVITELVLNHTSDQHPWFQKARRAKPGSRWRDFYVWSDTPDKYKEARIIFKDFETSNWTWDPVAKAYYWHRFYSHQPDLNYDHPAVRKTIFAVVDFWLSMGVDGMRLDAVPYLYEREGTNCENLPETHQFLKQLRAFVDQRHRGRTLLAEANQWPDDAVAYFGQSDECHMAFHFPLMPRLFMAIHMEDRFPIVDILEQTPPIPETCQWALFLRNHDELTLEMVTDEERDYMYRVYASDAQARINLGIRRRLAPLLGNNRRKIELMNGLLFSLPGTPVIYYGDEIGMGDNIYLGDRNGVRTPMQWSGDRNAGFSRANPQKLYLPVIIDPEYHYEAVNAEAQQNNPHSLLWWMKRLIALRRRYKAFGRGTLEMLHPENPRVLAFLRQYQEERLVVVANLSRFFEYAELDLSRFRGWTPVELFGGRSFPVVGDAPYVLTLGPHQFCWFQLVAPGRPAELLAGQEKEPLPELVVADVEDLWEGEEGELEEAIRRFLRSRPWFQGAGRQLKEVSLQDVIPCRWTEPLTWLLLIRAEFTSGEPETYTLPVALYVGARGEHLAEERRDEVLARVRFLPGQSGVLVEATEREFARAGLALLERLRKPLPAREGGELVVQRVTSLKKVLPSSDGQPEVHPYRGQHSHSLVVVAHQLSLKLFRKVEPGPNPEWEIGRLLMERKFPHCLATYAALQYRKAPAEPITLAVLHSFVPGAITAWEHTLHSLKYFLDQSVIAHPSQEPPATMARDFLELVDQEIPAVARETIGAFLEHARTLGVRVAELHRCLAEATQLSGLAPEPVTPFVERAMYQSMRNTAMQTLSLIKRQLRHLPEEIRAGTRRLLEAEGRVLETFRRVLATKITALRLCSHPNLQLAEILYTGRDFLIIDFEGSPTRPLGERRLKRLPVSDVASMVCSFLRAAHVAWRNECNQGPTHLGGPETLRRWVKFWCTWTIVAFLKGYLETSEGASFAPKTRKEWKVLLDAFLLERALEELSDELCRRPQEAAILVGVLQDLLQEPPASTPAAPAP